MNDEILIKYIETTSKCNYSCPICVPRTRNCHMDMEEFYSIIDNKYIYSIRILDDILANGTTDGYYYYEEKLILIEENNEFKLSIGEYIGDENPHILIEDDNMILEVTNKSGFSCLSPNTLATA